MRVSTFFRKLVAPVLAIVGFVLLYEVTTLDSKYAARQAVLRETTAPPAPGAKLRFSATAYCKGRTTASGVSVRTGIAAADPNLLPPGSVIQIDSFRTVYNGIYTVMDTGPTVHGRHVDIYLWSCNDALSFGRRSVLLTILRLGWDPRRSAPEMLETIFRRREQELSTLPLPSRPLPPVAPTPAVP